ncbi:MULTISPECIES: DUF2500 domain-containing protein [unclassified Sedimentibacter]|uniref:DUF2500 domain-containing protein n=1 Tax=unclassified Sedimentibacter TaxID=2649220 RepID=UPI0027E070F0|nr:DUF2500 domain-containing protein [Sedimentibacter sp. MB35-C1]WMJ78524.1 DUF2500 domain-containing protein [Sedimentibacter sp. MB35-C1]
MAHFNYFWGHGIMFSLFPIIFLFVFGYIVYTIIKNIQTNMHNNKQPIIPVEAKIISKRYDVTSRHRHRTDNMNMNLHTSRTLYYVTFELTNGERMEFQVPSGEFGMLAEGDVGTLNFQGTRFISFTR